MEIKVLETGCQKCKMLEKLVRKSIVDLNIDANISKVEDFKEIMQYNIMSTPALVIDEKVIFSGKLPNEKELKNIFEKKN